MTNHIWDILMPIFEETFITQLWEFEFASETKMGVSAAPGIMPCPLPTNIFHRFIADPVCVIHKWLQAWCQSWSYGTRKKHVESKIVICANSVKHNVSIKRSQKYLVISISLFQPSRLCVLASNCVFVSHTLLFFHNCNFSCPIRLQLQLGNPGKARIPSY